MGQLAAGRIIRGILVALPAVGVVMVAAALLARGRIDAVATLVSPGVLDVILIANVILALSMPPSTAPSALSNSENTAGVHVSNILGKLGVSRRMEAAAIAHHMGLALPEG